MNENVTCIEWIDSSEYDDADWKSEEEVKAAFDKLDKDGSGSLELPELVPLVKGII